jgi:hypothetical protein
MRCPRCNAEGLDPYGTCAKCQFSGLPHQVEELGHIAFLLGELETWREIGSLARNSLREHYSSRREELEISLRLRAAPLTAKEARELQWELLRLDRFQVQVRRWSGQGWIRHDSADRLRQGTMKRVETLRDRLKDAPPAPSFDSVQDRLKLLRYLEETLSHPRLRGHFVNDEAHAAALADLQEERRGLEIQAGLRPPPPEPVPEPVAAPEPVPVEALHPPARPPRPPREPVTWDRIWQTLLSERTLNILLFLGAFLMVASAITYVVYNWENLPPAAQLAAIVLFTLSFYGAGWFLRARMKLRASGIAVTAVGSLLVPLDFYAVGIAGGAVPADAWPWVWLVASAVCLPIYTFTALRIQAQFFGYPVAVAVGSLLSATLWVVGATPESLLPALVALALGLAVLAYRLKPAAPASTVDEPSDSEPVMAAESLVAEARGNAWSVLSSPLRFSALIGTTAILPLGIGWWVAAGAEGFSFDASVATAWLLGAAIYAYSAVREPSPLLGRAAATVLPGALLLILRLAFEPLGVEWPWYALGLAALAPVYLVAGHRWLNSAPPQSPPQAGERPDVQRAHGLTATGWGLALMAIAAVWSVFDLWAAAATHAVLVAGVALAVRLWKRPRALPVASLLAFSSITFGMAAGHLEPAELCLGWALLGLLHLIAALRLQTAPEYAARLFVGALVCAALALLPPMFFAHEPLLTYVLGHWIALAAWLVWLDHTGKHAGLTALLSRSGPLRQSALHWAITLPLPFFITMLYTRFRAPDAWLGLLLVLLAWAFFLVGQVRRLSSTSVVFRHWSFAWYVVGYGCSLAAPFLALHFYHQPLLAVTVMLTSMLYFVSAWAFRVRWWLVPAGLTLPLGLLILLDFWAVPWPQQNVTLALATTAYLLGGIGLERQRGVARRFMAPLYVVAHVVAALAVGWGLGPGVESLSGRAPWTDPARLWAAGGQLILGASYGLFAWFQTRERWAHVAAWLGVMAGGLIASAYSRGYGSSAFKAALLAAVYVLAERALASETLRGRWPLAERAWPLYRRALLIAGWAVSAGAVALALGRNLVLLGGGRSQAVWAIAGLLTVTALYALSAWLFRRRIFVWLAGVLVIAPWTLLTVWGWFLWEAPPPLARHALSWAILACLELFLGLALSSSHRAAARAGGKQRRRFGFPLRVMANLLLPFALFWGVADSSTSSLTWGLGVAFYVVSVLADHRRGLTAWQPARFLYPAVAALPVWALYLLNYFWPAAPYETYGLMLLALSPVLLIVGRLLRRVNAAYGMPLYLGTYGVAIVGTLLVAHQSSLFAAALTFDALLCVLSAWIFREPLWGYPAAALAPAAMLVALAQSQVPPERRGWWLIGLGAVYVALAWILHQLKRRGVDLRAYATAPLVMAFAVVALGLPPSSLDEAGAFWGYLAAALIYAVVATWLRQPLLLVPTAALLAVPYGVALVWLGVDPANYGLAIYPGVVIALALAHLLDWRLGRPGPILPSLDRRSWRLGALLDWWGAPFYAWGYVGALVAVGLSWTDSTPLAIALGLAAAAFLHATVRFRSRGSLLLAGALAQAAVLTVIDAAGWLADPAWAALAFLPVTMVTAALALAVELWRGEGCPLSAAWWRGWSRPLYLLLAVDLLAGQVAALFQSEPGALVTTVHTLLLALLATVWVQPLLPLAAAGLGIVGFFQAMAWAKLGATGYPVGLALLALGYGLLGYGWAYALRGSRRGQIWTRPLEWTALGLSVAALGWAAAIGLDAVDLFVRTLLGRTANFADYAAEVRMVMWVLALCGLLYLATAAVRRWYALGYGAVALLLGAWALWWRFFLDMPGVQWYAVPAGVYLLGVGWMEWRQGRKTVARWIDRVGMLVWLGTAWWQSLPGVMDSGWPYALIMGAESLLLVWWGSARRQKQFLYIGAAALVVNVVTQSIEPLLSVNRWIVFGIAGLLLVSLAILVERRLEKIRELSAELRVRLEGWE